MLLAGTSMLRLRPCCHWLDCVDSRLTTCSIWEERIWCWMSDLHLAIVECVKRNVCVLFTHKCGLFAILNLDSWKCPPRQQRGSPSLPGSGDTVLEMLCVPRLRPLSSRPMACLARCSSIAIANNRDRPCLRLWTLFGQHPSSCC